MSATAKQGGHKKSQTALNKNLMQFTACGNRNNIYASVYGVVTMAQPCESSRSSFDECRLRATATATTIRSG